MLGTTPPHNFFTLFTPGYRLTQTQYGPDIEYIKGENNIVANAISRIPLNRNQETTQNSTYQQEIVS